MEALREELRALHTRRARGEVQEKVFQRTLAERTVTLFRAAVRARLTPGEEILEEHHAVQGHLKLTQSMLKEPDQGAVSLFATDRRLIRLSATLTAGESPTCDERDHTVIDEVRYDEVRAIRMRRQVRTGEAAAGVAIFALAFLAGPLLSVTGPVLMLVGVLGVLHGLLMPTRWWEVEAAGRSPEDWFHVYTVRKRSAKQLVRLVRARAGSRRE